MASSRAPTPAWRSDGFTMVELMVTVGVVSILTALAVPSYRSFILEQRAIATSNDLLAAINAARSRAITSAERCEVTPRQSWSAGWNVDMLDRSATDEPVRTAVVKKNVDADMHISSSGAEMLAFGIDGALTEPPGGATFYVCSGSGSASHARAVRISPSGLANVTRELAYECN